MNDVRNNPKDPLAWAGLVGDTIDLLPFVVSVGETIKAFKAVDKVIDSATTINKVDNVVDTINITNKTNIVDNTVKKIHGNSLKCDKINYGYALLNQNNEIMKFGETINPQRRYTKKFLIENNYHMEILWSGSKIETHQW